MSELQRSAASRQYRLTAKVTDMRSAPYASSVRSEALCVRRPRAQRFAHRHLDQTSAGRVSVRAWVLAPTWALLGLEGVLLPVSARLFSWRLSEARLSCSCLRIATSSTIQLRRARRGTQWIVKRHKRPKDETLLWFRAISRPTTNVQLRHIVYMLLSDVLHHQ
jgi:hypothetical protein